MNKDWLELEGDDRDDVMSFMYKPVATGAGADPDGASFPWQINVYRKDDWGDEMFYDRHSDMHEYIDEKILSEDVNMIQVFFEGRIYEVYQLLMNNSWQYTNFRTGAVKIGTPAEIQNARALQGIPLGGWL